MAITISSLTTPSGSLSLVAGGDLEPNTTYYIRVTARGGRNINAFYYYVNRFHSCPSIEQSIATTDTERTIRVSDYVVAGAHNYTIYCSKISGDYSANKPCPVRGTTNTTYDISSESDWTYGWDSFIFSGNLPGGLDKELGTILINFDTEISLQDIKDELDGQGYGGYCYYDGYFFVFKGGFYCTNADGSLIVLQRQVYFLEGMPYATTGLIQFGEDHVTAGPRYGCTLGIAGYEIDIGNLDNVKFYDCRLLRTSSMGLSNRTYLWGGNSFYQATQYVKGCTFAYGGIRRGGGSSNLTIQGATIYVQGQHNNMKWVSVQNNVDWHPAYLYTLTLSNNASHDFRMIGGVARDYENPRIFDGDFNRISKMPVIKWTAPLTDDPDLRSLVLFYSIHIKVTDKSGNPLSGAELYMSNKDGTNVVFVDSGSTVEQIIQVTDTVFDISDASSFSINDYIRVDEEIMKITEINENTLTVLRGQAGSNAQKHFYYPTTYYYFIPKVYLRKEYLVADGDGEMPEFYVQTKRLYHKEGSGEGTGVSYTDVEDNNPFEIKIIIPDYEDYENKFTLEEKVDWTIVLQQKFIVKSIHSKASKSVYNEGDIAEISGGVTLSNDLSGVSVLMEIRKASDDSIMAVLLDTTYDFVADIEVSYETLNGGSNPTWDTVANIDEFYFRILLSHVDLEGDKEDKEYFYAGLAELEPELIELLDEIETIEMDEEDLELIEIE